MVGKSEREELNALKSVKVEKLPRDVNQKERRQRKIESEISVKQDDVKIVNYYVITNLQFKSHLHNQLGRRH